MHADVQEGIGIARFRSPVMIDHVFLQIAVVFGMIQQDGERHAFDVGQWQPGLMFAPDFDEKTPCLVAAWIEKHRQTHPVCA